MTQYVTVKHTCSKTSAGFPPLPKKKKKKKESANLKVFCDSWRESSFHSVASSPTVTLMAKLGEQQLGEKVRVTGRISDPAGRETALTPPFCPAGSELDWAAYLERMEA